MSPTLAITAVSASRSGESGRDERTEDDDQDGQRQRYRSFPGLLQLVREELVEGLARADRPGLTDIEAGVRLRHVGRGRRDRVDVLPCDLLVSLHLPLDQHRSTVLRDLVGAAGVERGAQVRDRRKRLHRSDDVGDRGAKGSILDRQPLALDQHDLGLRIGSQAGLLEDLVGLTCLADVRVLHAGRLLADDLADGDGGDHEGEPTEDRRLPVACAPAAHAGRKVVAGFQRGHGWLLP